MTDKRRAPRNRTIGLSESESARLAGRLLRLDGPAAAGAILGRTICQNLFEVLPYLPAGFVDLLIVDPPYNLDKSFNSSSFKGQSSEAYAACPCSGIRKNSDD